MSCCWMVLSVLQKKNTVKILGDKQINTGTGKEILENGFFLGGCYSRKIY